MVDFPTLDDGHKSPHFMSSNKHRFNTDHVYARSQGGTDNPINRREVDRNWHAALHRIFGNLTPHDRVIQLLNWDSQVIISPALNELLAITKQRVHDGMFYQDGVCR